MPFNAQQGSPPGLAPVPSGDAPSASSQLVLGAAFEDRATFKRILDLEAFETNKNFIEERSQGGGSNFKVRCGGAFKAGAYTRALLSST